MIAVKNHLIGQRAYLIPGSFDEPETQIGSEVTLCAVIVTRNSAFWSQEHDTGRMGKLLRPPYPPEMKSDGLGKSIDRRLISSEKMPALPPTRLYAARYFDLAAAALFGCSRASKLTVRTSNCLPASNFNRRRRCCQRIQNLTAHHWAIEIDQR